jgi:hypothetical protein
MKRTLLVSLLVLTSLALAQGKPNPAKETKDAGVPAPALTVAKPDAGTAIPGAPAPATVADVDKLRKELADLRAKTTDLEARLTKAEALAKDTEQLRGKLEKLEARLDAADDRREAEEQEVARKKAVAAQNGQLINGALQALSTGNTTNVDAWLRTAEQNSSGNAQKLLQLARQALSQQDLVAARSYLALAMMEPQ